jgi:hypothetical protein
MNDRSYSQEILIQLVSFDEGYLVQCVDVLHQFQSSEFGYLFARCGLVW